MTALECLQGRRSVRKFTEQSVPLSVLQTVVETARFAPSWKNSQTARYIAVTQADVKADIAQNCVLGHPFNQKTIERSAVLVVLVYQSGVSGYETDGTASTPMGSHWESFDAGIAAQTFCLSAYEQGLGTVILGIYDGTAVAERLSLAEGERVGALIAMGYPEKIGVAPPRKSVEELLTVL